MTRYLTLELALEMIDVAAIGPMRDIGLLEAAIQRPRTSVFGADAYPTLDEKVAAQFESIVRNHPLVDGNKRLGWLTTVVFYRRNGVRLHAPDDPAYDLVIGIAEGRVDYHESAATLAAWTSTST